MNLFCSLMRILLAGLAVLEAGTSFGQKPLVLEGHENVVSAIAFSGDGKQIFSASWDKTVRVWDTSAGRQESLLEGHTDWVFDLCLLSNSDGTGVRSASQNELLQWSPAFRRTAQQTNVGGATVNSATFSPDGQYLAAAAEGGQLGRLGSQRLLRRVTGGARVLSSASAGDQGEGQQGWKK